MFAALSSAGVCCFAFAVFVSDFSVFRTLFASAASWVPSQFSPNFWKTEGRRGEEKWERGKGKGGGLNLCLVSPPLWQTPHQVLWPSNCFRNVALLAMSVPVGKWLEIQGPGKMRFCVFFHPFPLFPPTFFIAALSGTVYQLPPTRHLLKDLLHFTCLPFPVFCITDFASLFLDFFNWLIHFHVNAQGNWFQKLASTLYFILCFHLYSIFKDSVHNIFRFLLSDQDLASIRLTRH